MSNLIIINTKILAPTNIQKKVVSVIIINLEPGSLKVYFYFTTFKWERETSSLIVFSKFIAEGPLSEYSTSNVNCSPSFKYFRPEFLTAEKWTNISFSSSSLLIKKCTL